MAGSLEPRTPICEYMTRIPDRLSEKENPDILFFRKKSFLFLKENFLFR